MAKPSLDEPYALQGQLARLEFETQPIASGVTTAASLVAKLCRTRIAKPLLEIRTLNLYDAVPEKNKKG